MEVDCRLWKSGVPPSKHTTLAKEEATRRINNQHSPVFRVVAYTLAHFIWWTSIDFEHRHQSNSNLFYMFKHVGQVNLMMLAIKAGSQIAAKVGNVPANQVFRRKIWVARDNGIPPRSTPR